MKKTILAVFLSSIVMMSPICAAEQQKNLKKAESKKEEWLKKSLDLEKNFAKNPTKDNFTKWHNSVVELGYAYDDLANMRDPKTESAQIKRESTDYLAWMNKAWGMKMLYNALEKAGKI
ncbi:MAG TPA: hypothetical protein VFF04_03775 [Candidatus Babeliales bacterium]|nr:hypothetical protein [Candidatus Babeliales bacterium]